MNLHSFLNQVKQLYWRIIKPKTFGVKATVLHPDRPDQILLVLHNYGSQNAWNLPGGGFNPRTERAEDAILRELAEELAIQCTHVHELGTYFTDAQGKRDTVIIFSCLPISLEFAPNAEIKEFKWVEISEIAGNTNYYRIVRHAADLLLRK